MSGIAFSLAAMTLILACVGIFGVMSYEARLRRKELSIRQALGAERRSLILLLVNQLARPAAFGITFGLALGLAVSRILESQGIYLGSIDAFVLITVTLTITSTCAAAAVIPALRALRMNVAETLRNE